MNYSHGLRFEPLPECLKGLTETEERLLSPRIPFMIIRSYGITKQNELHGNIVNVPMAVQETLKKLPRAINENQTCLIKWKRMMKYKNAYLCEYIRPFKVMQAFEYLQTTELYKENNITLSEDWKNIDQDSDLIPFEPHDKLDENDSDSSDTEFIKEEVTNTNIDNNDNKKSDIQLLKEDEKWDERDDEEKQMIGNTDTILDEYSNEGLLIAPGEGQIPRSILYDKDATELTFPTIFAGKRYKVKNKLSFSKIARVQLRNIDKRARKTSYLFYMMKKAQTQRISSAITLCMRKKLTNLTASDILNKKYTVDDFVSQNTGYGFLKAERNSPVYWFI